MSQSKRIGIAVLLLVLVIGTVIAIETRRGQLLAEADSSTEIALETGSIPIFADGKLITGFTPAELETLPLTSFVDAEEGKTQEGQLLSDTLLHYAKGIAFAPQTEIIVSSSSREKAITLTWAEVSEPANAVLFDLSGRGTLKLVSAQIERFDIRDEWIQDVDKIEIRTTGE